MTIEQAPQGHAEKPKKTREQIIFEAARTSVFNRLDELKAYNGEVAFYSSAIYSPNLVSMALNVDRTLAYQARVAVQLGIPVVSALDFLKIEMKLRLLKRPEGRPEGHWNHTLWQDVLESGKISHFILPPNWTDDHPEISIDEYGIARGLRRAGKMEIYRLTPRRDYKKELEAEKRRKQQLPSPSR